MIVTDFTSRTALTHQLHEMARLDKSTDKACRFLLEMRADVNGLSSEGKTPLQTALACNNLSVAKILVDYNAFVTPQDEEGIQRCLMDASLEMEGSDDPETTKQTFVSSGLARSWFDDFMVRRPRVNEPQVLFNGHWEYLSQFAGSKEQIQFTKPLALFLYADEPSFWKNYGSVTQKFSSAWDKNYAQVTPWFTPVRAFVRDVEQAISLIKSVKQFFPYLYLLALEIEAHANRHRVDFSKGGSLHQYNESAMERMANLLDLVGTIAFWGCSAGKGEDNLVQTFSRLAKGRVVFGSPHKTCEVRLQVACSVPPMPPILIPTFRSAKRQGMETVMYRKGELMAQGDFTALSGRNNPIALACRTFVSEQAKTFFEKNKPKESDSKTLDSDQTV